MKKFFTLLVALMATVSAFAQGVGVHPFVGKAVYTCSNETKYTHDHDTVKVTFTPPTILFPTVDENGKTASFTITGVNCSVEGSTITITDNQSFTIAGLTKCVVKEGVYNDSQYPNQLYLKIEYQTTEMTNAYVLSFVGDVLTETAVSDVKDAKGSTKTIVGGKIIIAKDGKQYNILGAQLK